jgi:SSS family solute:Na+ symporter
VAIAMINVKSALDAWWKLASVFSGGMLGLFLLGIFSTLKNTKAVLFATLMGVCVIMVLTLSDVLNTNFLGIQIHGYLTIVIGTLTIFLIGFGIGLLVNSKISTDQNY